MSKLRITRAGGLQPRVQCEDCDQLHHDSTRERVRQHVKTTGHTVNWITTHITTYEPQRQAGAKS